VDQAIAAVRDRTLLGAETPLIVISGAVVAHFTGVNHEVTAIGQVGPGTEGRRTRNMAGRKSQEAHANKTTHG